MKLLKEIKLQSIFIYSFVVFFGFFLIILVVSIFLEERNKELFHFQVETNKINKKINSLKNYQDNMFLYNFDSYLYDTDEFMEFNTEVFELTNLLDSINDLSLIKNKALNNELIRLKAEIEKYYDQSIKIVTLNGQIYAPKVGIRPQINILSQKLYEENKYAELGLLKYVDKIKKDREDLLATRITRRQFDVEFQKTFQEIAKENVDNSEKYYLMLFEDNITVFYNNSQVEYAKMLEIGVDYDQGLLAVLSKQHSILINITNSIENSLVKRREELFREKIIIYLIVTLLVLFFNIALLYYLYIVLYKPWVKMQKLLNSIALGELKTFEIHDYIKEVKLISNTLKTIFDKLAIKNNIIKELTNKNYDIEFEIDEKDELGKSLIKLRNELLEAEKEAAQYRETEEHQKWTATGIAQVGAVMRQNTEDVEQLAKNVLNEIIKYIDAVQGAMYLYNTDENVLELTAAFSYGKARQNKHTIQPYEGLLGTILIEKREYYYSTVPENYIFLETGLGYSKPNSLFAFPLLFENEIYGVVELASMSQFDEFKRNFLLNLGNEIAITISYTKINEQTKKLLEQSEYQAFNLQSNEKLHKKNQENLKNLLQETELKLKEKENSLKIKDDIMKEKVTELLELQKELTEKDDFIEKMHNENENYRSELENKVEELQNKIIELEKRLNEK